jgi:hypothetical protein
MRIKLSVAALAIIGLAAPAAAQTMTELWRTGGFAMPESVWHEPSTSQLVVSNIGVFGPDGGTDGRLSLLATDGTLVAADWVTGLVDPKGMASHDGTLYVADATGLHVIDIGSGVLARTVPLPGAIFPNDVTMGPDGTAYVTDMMGNAVLTVRGDDVAWLVPQGGIPLPNGILWHDGGLIVGSFGAGMNDDFSVTAPGGLYRVDPADGTVTPVSAAQGVASIDGIVAIGDMVVFDDNPSGSFHALQDGTLVTLGTTAPGAADLGVSGDTVFVPFLSSGEIVAYRVE